MVQSTVATRQLKLTKEIMQPLQETQEDEEKPVVSEPSVSEEAKETTYEEQDKSWKQNGNVTIEQQRKDSSEEKTVEVENNPNVTRSGRLVKVPRYLRDYEHYLVASN